MGRARPSEAWTGHPRELEGCCGQGHPPINLALLILAVVTCLFEAGIFWMILQDYRKVREMPELSPKRLTVLTLFSLGPLLALLLIWLFATNIHSKSEPPPMEHAATVQSVSDVPTSLRLQFNAANTDAIGIDLKNIWRWYTFRNIAQGTDENKEPFRKTLNTIIFITFDKPVRFKQIIVDSFGASLPTYEVKDSSSRHALVVFDGELIGTNVEIKAIY
jgi:hypothetical protein